MSANNNFCASGCSRWLLAVKSGLTGCLSSAYVRAFIYLTGLILLGNQHSVLAQTRVIDSLKQELAGTVTLRNPGVVDTVHMNLLIQLGYNESYYNMDSSNHFLNEGLKMARKAHRWDRIGDALSFIGSNFYYCDQYDSALVYFNNSMAAYKRDGSLISAVSMATVHSEIADIWVQKGNYTDAVKVYLNVIDTLKRFDNLNYNSIGNIYLAVGAVYRNMQQYRKSLSYDRLGVAALQKDKDKPDVAALGKLGLLSNLISLHLYKEAEAVLKEVEHTAKQLGSNKILIQTYGNWAGLYDAKNEEQAALGMYKKTLALAERSGDLHSQSICLIQIGLINSSAPITNYRKAIQYLDPALDLVIKLGNKHQESKVLRALGEIHQKLGHSTQAVRYYTRYLKLSDSLNEAETKIKINELEDKYASKKKSDSLLVMHKNAELSVLQLRRKQSANTGLIIGCVLLILLAAALYRNYKRKNQLLKQARQLHIQKIQELEKQRQMVAMQSVIQGQEAERSRLAKDLHDGVGGLLSGVKLSLSTMKGNVFLSAQNVRAVTSVIDQLDASIQELRRVSHNMMPEALIKYGLREALENYADGFNEAGQLNIRLQAFGMDSRMDQDTEIVIYRIVQELLGNVIKHAGANQVLIQLVRKQDRFTLTVEDDGKGFVEAGMQHTGAGLSNIKARAAYLNGTVDIHSQPGRGTSITVEGRC